MPRKNQPSLLNTTSMLFRESKLIGIVLFLFCLSVQCLGQEIPAGVRYKPAPESINIAVKSSLERALAGDSFPNTVLKDIFTCGPMLWHELKPAADEVLLESKVVVGFVETPEPTQVEARALVTAKQRRTFWDALLKKYPRLRSAKVRKATAKEILYYWATIPFDIDEPFFAIDTGTEVFIAHFGSQAPSLFWIDLVGDLHALKGSKPSQP